MLDSSDAIRLVTYFHHLLISDITPGINKNTIILSSYNPLKLCVLLYEVLSKISKKLKGLDVKAGECQQDLEDLMLKLVSRVDSEYELHLILNDHDYLGRPLFKLIVDLELPTLFYRL